jgi:hypothetical protein
LVAFPLFPFLPKEQKVWSKSFKQADRDLVADLVTGLPADVRPHRELVRAVAQCHERVSRARDLRQATNAEVLD